MSVYLGLQLRARPFALLTLATSFVKDVSPYRTPIVDVL